MGNGLDVNSVIIAKFPTIVWKSVKERLTLGAKIKVNATVT